MLAPGARDRDTDIADVRAADHFHENIGHALRSGAPRTAGMAPLLSRARNLMVKKDPRTHPNAAAFPRGISGPALRALAAAGIRSVADLDQWAESDLAKLHGMGPKALALLSSVRKAGRKARRSS